MKKNAVREPIATWWKINPYRAEITPVKVVAFTAAFVTTLHKEWRFTGPDVLRERRERRNDVYPTFAEAKAAYIQMMSKRIDYAKDELQRHRSMLGQIESMTEPS